MASTDTCQLCQQGKEPAWRCSTCDQKLCNDCRTVHVQNQFTNDHSMISLDAIQTDQLLLCTTKGNVSYCSIHKSEVSQMYCYQCYKAVCLDCLSNDHAEHDVVLISNEIDNKRSELRRIIHQSKSKLSAYRSEILSVKNRIDNYSEETASVADSMKRHGEVLKAKIDDIVQDCIKSLQNDEKSKKSHLRQIQSQIETETIDLAVFIAKCEKKLKSTNDVSLITAVSKISKRPEIKEPVTSALDVQPSRFVPGKIDIDGLRTVFGCIEKTASSVPSVQAEDAEPKLDAPCVTVMTSFDSPPPSADCVATINNRFAWLGWRWIGKEIFLVSIRGKIKCQVLLDFTLGDLSATSDGKLFFTVGGSHYVKRLVDRSTCVDVTDTAPFVTRGLHVTENNQILVCLYNLNNNQGKVTRMSLKGEPIQDIQYDKSNNALFNYPQDVIQNVNGDVCVIDRIAPSVNKHELVVVDKNGGFRFRYSNSKDQKSCSRNAGRAKKRESIGFVCTGIVSDTTGCILLSDRENNKIHLIDKDGNFIKFILTESDGIKSPTGLSMDKNRHLWLCNDYKSVVVAKLK